MKRAALFLMLLLAFPAAAHDGPSRDYGRGYVPLPKETLDALHAEAKARHAGRVRGLPKVTDPSYDCRKFGYVPAIKDQASCGSCWNFSGVDTCEMAFMRAGALAVDSGGFSEQYVMDYHKSWGGCNGGDEANPIIWCKSNGLPLTKDWNGVKGYNVPYAARAGTQRPLTGVKMWKIEDWGYCHLDQGFGIASTQEIKNAIAAWGPVSVALDARAFNSYSGGVMVGSGSSVDHAVIIVGWQDDATVKGGGWWIVRNQWGPDWGEGGYCRIGYGSYSIGTEAMWVSVTQLPPPPPPPVPPVPPTPVPPVPPAPTPGTTLYSMKYNADGSITFSPSASGVLTPDQLKALRDEVQKLHDMLEKSRGADRPPCEEVKKLQAQIDDLRKQVEADRAAVNKNLSDLIDVVGTNQRAIEMLHKKQGTAPAKEPEPVKPPTKSKANAPREEGSGAIVVQDLPVPNAPVTIDGRATSQTGAVRQYATPAIRPGDTAVYTVAMQWEGVWLRQEAYVGRGQVAVVDFTK